jgi:hypothetical protein
LVKMPSFDTFAARLEGKGLEGFLKKL